jgi:hypothetical protein
MGAGDWQRRDALILSRVRRIRRAFARQVWREQALAPAWAAATTVAALRLFAPGWAMWVGPPLVLTAAAVWVLRASARSPSMEMAAVVADRSADAGGLLLTRLEAPVGEWELPLNARVRALQAPRLPWVRSSAGLLLAALFAAGVFAVPIPVPVSRVNAAAAGKVEEVEAQVEAVVKEEPLSPALLEELERLRAEAEEGGFEASDWEAADHLSGAVEAKAAEAASKLARASEAAAELEAALDSGAADRQAEALEEALMQLSDGAQLKKELSGASAGSDGGMAASSSLAEKSAQSGADARQSRGDRVAQLRRSLEQRRSELARAFGQNAQNGQRSAQQQQKGGSGQGPPQSGQGKPGQSAQGGQPGQNGSPGERGSSSEHASHAVQPGSGPSHGPGQSNELTYGGIAEMDPARLELEPLPPGQGGDPGELHGVHASNPRPGPGSARGSATGAAAEGERLPGHPQGPVLPRNQQLIQRYFGGN